VGEASATGPGPAAAAQAAAPARVRPLRDRVVWRLAGHGGWVEADALAQVLKCQQAPLAAALVALRDEGVVEARPGVGWRLAGPALARAAARELVRELAKGGARRVSSSVVQGAVVRFGLAQLEDVPTDAAPDAAPDAARSGGGLGFVLVELVAPLPPGADGLERLQALVDRWCAAFSTTTTTTVEVANG
jgi:hypothetical protein